MSAGSQNLNGINKRPRNLWTRLKAVLELVENKDFYRAHSVLDGVRYHPSMTDDVMEIFRRNVDTAQSRAGVPAKVNLPSDYLSHSSRLMRPDFPRLSQNRIVPSPYPAAMPLPSIVGARNDYRFLEDAATRLTDRYSTTINRVHILFSPRARQDIEAVLKTIETLVFDGRVDLSIFHSGNDRLADQVTCCLPGEGQVDLLPFPILSEEGAARAAKAAENANIVVFLTGRPELDELALLRSRHMLSASDRVVQPIIATSDAIDPLSSPFTSSLLLSKAGESYPFRAVKGLNMAVPADLLRSVGGLDTRFNSTFFAACELAYRMFNKGAYFAPLAVPGLFGYRDDKEHAKDAALYVNTCPNHWDRKKDGRFEIPKVSVYIPAYKASKYIERAVNSVLEQDVADLDVCIANDGSPDDTLDLLERLYGNEPRVRWVDHPNGGIGFASNQAIRQSGSLYIGQLDSDDCLKPGAVRRLMEYLDEHPDVVCAYGSCERIDSDGNYIKDEYSWPAFSREKMMITSIAHHFRMFRRQAWERTTNFREDIVNAVDYDIFLKLSETGKFHHVDEVLYQRRWHGENTSNVDENFQTSNTYRVQNEALERLGMLESWQAHVPDPNEPRRVTYKLRDDKKMVMFWPDYSRSNPYQKLLYGKLRHESQVVAGDENAALMIVGTLEDPSQLVFHLHWTNFLFKGISDPDEAQAKAEAFIERINELVGKGARVVWTIHNHLSHDSPYPEVEIWLSNELCKAVHALHFHSEASIPEVAEVFDVPQEKVFVSQHGSYVGHYPDFVTRDQARRQLGIDTDDDVILFSGQVRPYKGGEQLVTSFRKLLKERPNLRLLIVGEMRFDLFGSMTPALTKEEHSRITATHRFVDDMELQLFFRAADFAVYPYKKILTSGSLLLSLSFGLPVIIPEVGMTREVLEGRDAGVLLRHEDDGDKLKAALTALLNAKGTGELSNMASNARSIAEELGWPEFTNILKTGKG